MKKNENDVTARSERLREVRAITLLAVERDALHSRCAQ